MHATLAKFGYPETLIADCQYWAVVLRPRQITLGSCTIISKSDATALGALSAAAWSEFGTVTAKLEAALQAAFSYDKINYLCLMLVDPQVHFHALPRYAAARAFEGRTFNDAYWPKPPELNRPLDLTAPQLATLQAEIRRHWPA